MGFSEVDSNEIGTRVCASVQSIGLKAALLIHPSKSEDDGEQSSGFVVAQQHLPSSSREQRPGSRVLGHFPVRSERKAEILSRCHTDVSTFHSPNDPQLNLGSDQGGAEY